MFSSIDILRTVWYRIAARFLSKPLFYGINYIPRFYNALYYPVICIPDVIEFRFVSMSIDRKSVV